MAARKGVNCKVAWVLGEALAQRNPFVRGQPALARPDNPTAAAYSGHGVGRSPPLTRLARCFKELESADHCALAAWRDAGGDNPAADALSRPTSKVS